MDSQDMIRLEILLCLLHGDDESCSVTGMSRTLQREKYAISRTLKYLEDNGLVKRSDPHRPRLTEKGYRIAKAYDEKVNVSTDHLLYEGVDAANARSDAMVWALYNSKQTMDVIRRAQARCQAKFELRAEGSFGGDVLCRHLPDGNYMFPFIIYKGHIRDGNILSMANEGFAHPCILSVNNRIGTLQLRAVKMKHRSRKTGMIMSGSVSSLKYFADGYYTPAGRVGDILTIPAAALRFENIGSGIGQILHGTVFMKMKCTVGIVHMPESTALFAILI